MLSKRKRIIHAALLWDEHYLRSERPHTGDALLLSSTGKSRKPRHCLHQVWKHSHRRQWILLVPVLTVCSHHVLLQPLRPPLLPRLKFIRSLPRWRSFGKNHRITDPLSPVTTLILAKKNLSSSSPDLTEFTVDEVLPDTAYRYFISSWFCTDRIHCHCRVSSRIRVRAVNSIGQGPFSSTVKCQTKNLPPDVPQLECTLTTCNSIKLKWNTVNQLHSSVNQTSEQSATRVITYIIEMEGKDGM